MKVWLFDIDGTLILSGGAGQKAVFATIENEFGVAAQPDGVAFAGRTDRAIAREVFQRHRIPENETNWHQYRQSYLTHLRQTLLSTSGQVLTGVRELLTRLHSSDSTHIGLLTGNVQAGAEAKLRHYELWEFFAFGGYGDRHMSRDDVAGEALSRAQSHLNDQVRPDNVLVVGDTVNDVRCAKAIGARAIAVATGGTSKEELAEADPDVLLDDLSPSPSLERLIQYVIR